MTTTIETVIMKVIIDIETTIEKDLAMEAEADLTTETEANHTIEIIAIVDIIRKKEIEDATIAAERGAIVKDLSTAGPAETAETGSTATRATPTTKVNRAHAATIENHLGNILATIFR